MYDLDENHTHTYNKYTTYHAEAVWRKPLLKNMYMPDTLII